MPPSDRFPHLLLPRPAEPDVFKPKAGGPKRKIPSREREEHGTRLMEQLAQAQKDALARRRSGEAEARALGIVLSDGIYLEFDIADGQQQSLKSLESERKLGIELCAVYEVHKPPSPPLTRATVYVPRGQLGYFESRIEKYLSEASQFGRPKNEALVASIQDIRLATVQSLWTDAEDVLPSFGEPLWWEVWLRKNDSEMLQQFRRDAEGLQLRVDEPSLMFPDRGEIGFPALTLLCRENLILFAEGTSTDGCHILPFKSSLFSVAEQPLKDGMPIYVQPVSITAIALDGLPMGRTLRPLYAWYGNMTLAAHGWPMLRLGRMKVAVEFHPAVRSTDYKDRKALAGYCSQMALAGVNRALTGRDPNLKMLPAPQKERATPRPKQEA